MPHVTSPSTVVAWAPGEDWYGRLTRVLSKTNPEFVIDARTLGAAGEIRPGGRFRPILFWWEKKQLLKRAPVKRMFGRVQEANISWRRSGATRVSRGRSARHADVQSKTWRFA